MTEKPKRRALPESKAELKEKLAIYEFMASPVVGAVSAGFELGGMKPLSTKETEQGEFALGSLLYQYGAELDAKLLCLLWAASVSGPRLMQLAKDKREKEKRKVDALRNPILAGSNPNPTEVP